MPFVRYSLPSFRQWVLAALLAMLCMQVWSMVPPREPVVVAPGSIGAEAMPNGSMRFSRTVTVREICASVTVRRFFRGSIDGTPVADTSYRALASSRTSLDPIFAGTMTRVGTFTDWWEYAPIPGFKGSFIVTAAVADCPSGYNGVFTLYVIPVDWTGVGPGRR